MSLIIKGSETGKTGSVTLVDKPGVNPTDADLIDRDKDISLDLRDMVGSGVSDETNKAYHSLTSKDGTKGSADWYPVHYNPKEVDTMIIKRDERAMVAGPFEIKAGETVTVQPDATFIIL